MVELLEYVYKIAFVFDIYFMLNGVRSRVKQLSPGEFIDYMTDLGGICKYSPSVYLYLSDKKTHGVA